MCVININLNSTIPTDTFISSANGQYRKVGDINWIDFEINPLSPVTPDVTILGNYELRVRITNNLGFTSQWSNISTFEVSTSCGGGSTLGSINPVCRENSCNDNALCGVQFNVATINTNPGDYIEVQYISGNASVVVIQEVAFGDVPQIRYVEPNGLAEVNFDLQLRNSSGIVIYEQNITMSHQSFWNQLPLC